MKLFSYFAMSICLTGVALAILMLAGLTIDGEKAYLCVMLGGCSGSAISFALILKGDL